jgi:hypothetical protein
VCRPIIVTCDYFYSQRLSLGVFPHFSTFASPQVRKLYGRFWNLNSTLDRPETIGEFYLSAFLAQMQTDGYDVFIVSPTDSLPPPPRADPDEGGYDRGATYHRVVGGVLQRPGDGIGGGGTKRPADPWATAGAGHTLRAGNAATAAVSSEVIGVDEEEDDNDLALAIAMSMAASAENSTVASGPSPAPSSTRPAPSELASDPASTQPTAPLPPRTELLPEAGEGEPAARVLVRGGGLPARFSRRFRPEDPAVSVFGWIDAALAQVASISPAAPGSGVARAGAYELLLQRTVLARPDVEASGITCEGAGLTPSAALMLRPV